MYDIVYIIDFNVKFIISGIIHAIILILLKTSVFMRMIIFIPWWILIMAYWVCEYDYQIKLNNDFIFVFIKKVGCM